jgi:hypothetical protein
MRGQNPILMSYIPYAQPFRLRRRPVVKPEAVVGAFPRVHVQASPSANENEVSMERDSGRTREQHQLTKSSGADEAPFNP